MAHHDRGPGARRPPDLVQRDFTAERPDQLWVADFTYLRCWEGLVFFSFVIDVFSPPRRGLAVRQPHAHRPGPATRCGWRSPAATPAPTVSSCTTPTPAANTPATHFTQVLDDYTVLASIGSVGDAYDNALAESFVDSFKTELIRDRVWQTRTQLELAIVEWV